MRHGIRTLLALALIAGCGDGDSGGGDVTAFTGVVSGSDGATSGSIALSIASASLLRSEAELSLSAPRAQLLVVVDVSGTLIIDGGPSIALSGTYDTDSGILSVSGGGYVFNGIFDGTLLEGTWTGPGGTGGTFVSTAGASATAFCGTYAASDQTESGTFSFVISGSSLVGEAVSSVDGSYTPLDGTVSGNSITVFIPGTTLPLAVGTRSGNTVSGTYDDQAGSTGTWTGSACN